MTLQYKESFEGLLILIMLIGVIVIFGSISVLIIGTWLNPSWMFQGIALLFPLFLVGIIVTAISVKLQEVLN